MRVFLDDDKTAQKRIKWSQGYDVWVTTADEAIAYLKTGNVTAISLDHDLGDETNLNCGNGYDVAVWIEEAAFNNQIPRLDWRCHTQNPIGRTKMITCLKNADRFWGEHES